MSDNETLLDLVQRCTRIEDKLDGLSKFKDDIETRMRSQEKRSWITMGASLVLAFVAPIFGIKYMPM